MSGPLEGIKVVELGHWVAVPSACAILGDWGAGVIKIEEPGIGDAVRGVRSLEGVATVVGGVHGTFEQLNRNKKSIAVNLKHEQGREIVHKLIQKADVFVTNFQPPVLKRFEMDYPSLSRLNPQLIYAVLSGYGQKGPDKDKPGYDYSAFWARSGLQCKSAWRGMPPSPQRPGLGDNIVSMLIAGGIATALFARSQNGMGQEVCFSLYHTGVWALNTDIEQALFSGTEIPNHSREAPRNPLWNVYQMKDGYWLQLVMVQSDRFWSRFCKAMEIEHLEHDPKYENSLERETNAESLTSIITNIFKTRNLAEWEGIFDENELVYGRVQTVTDVINDPQAWENDFFTEVDHPVAGKIKMINSPVIFHGTPASIKSAAPEHGQHTEEILLELGYDWGNLTNFKEQKVIL